MEFYGDHNRSQPEQSMDPLVEFMQSPDFLNGVSFETSNYDSQTYAQPDNESPAAGMQSLAAAATVVESGQIPYSISSPPFNSQQNIYDSPGGAAAYSPADLFGQTPQTQNGNPAFERSPAPFSDVNILENLIMRLESTTDQDHYEQFVDQVQEKAKYVLKGQQETLFDDSERNSIKQYFYNTKGDNVSCIIQMFNSEDYSVAHMTGMLECHMRLSAAFKIFTKYRAMFDAGEGLELTNPESLVKLLLFARLLVPRLRHLMELLRLVEEPLPEGIFM